MILPLLNEKLEYNKETLKILPLSNNTEDQSCSIFNNGNLIKCCFDLGFDTCVCPNIFACTNSKEVCNTWSFIYKKYD